MSDGSIAGFGPVASAAGLKPKCAGDSLEAEVYRQMVSLLSNKENRDEIAREFPKPSIHRRNTGYALYSLLDCAPFSADGPPFILFRFLSRSQDTLTFFFEIPL